MTKSVRIDLDAARRAREDKGRGPGPTVTFRGKTFQLPAEVPYGVYRTLAQLSEAKETDARAGLMVGDLIEGFFGEKQWAEFEALGPSLDDVVTIFQRVFEGYSVTLGESQASLESSNGTGTQPKPRSKRATASNSARRSSEGDV